jgi:hypothetical protein
MYSEEQLRKMSLRELRHLMGGGLTKGDEWKLVSKVLFEKKLRGDKY